MRKANPDWVRLHFLLAVTLILIVILAGAALVGTGLSPRAFSLIITAIILASIAFIITAFQIYRGRQAAAPPQGPEPAFQAAPPQAAAQQKPALMLLSLLQEKGRLLDFLMEDIDSYSDKQVNAAARVVHQGCREVINNAFEPVHITEQKEKSEITLPANYSSDEFKITGSMPKEPPYKGTLLHRGWRASKMKLPQRTRNTQPSNSPVIIPAEVEV
ncbi:MAG: DUF2760 domain-containing protein [Chitinivibrionales bacterium]|nr:DUF2760 domain-containing protein [Chitinivibrionales bacterium]